MKNVIKIIAIILAIGFIANSYSTYRMAKRLRQAEKAYKVALENHENYVEKSQKRIGMLISDRQKTENRITNMTTEVDNLHNNNSSLRKKWSEERQRKLSTIAQAARREEIAENLIQGMGNEVDALKTQINNYYELTNNLKLELSLWKKMYEDEHALHLKLQSLYKSVKLYRKLKRFGVGLFAGIGYGIDGEFHPNAGVGFVVRF